MKNGSAVVYGTNLQPRLSSCPSLLQSLADTLIDLAMVENSGFGIGISVLSAVILEI